MELDDFLSQLNKVKKSGKGYIALCPAHDDKKHSLSITADKEKILVKCFTGCSTEDIMKSLGLTMADLFVQVKRAGPRVVKTYDYTDEAGDLLYQVCRLQPKEFR